MKTLLFCLAVPLAAAAQIASVDLTAPTAGYRFDPESHSLRPIDGIPGAASLGAPMALEVVFEEVLLAPGQRLAFGAPTGATRLTRLQLRGATAAVDATEIPRGSLFYSSNGQMLAVVSGDRLEVWTGLAGVPRRLASYEMGEGMIHAAALSDDGGAVVILREGSLFRLDQDGMQEVASGVSGAAFLPNSQDLLLLQQGQLLLLAKMDPERQQDLAAIPGMTRFVLSSDGTKLLLEGEGKLLLLSTRGGEPVAVHLPEGDIEALSTGDGAVLFQVAMRDGRLFLLDGGGTQELALVDAPVEGGNQ